MPPVAPAPVEDDDRLFARLYPTLRRFAAVVAPRETDPDDLLQEATARALRHGPLTRLDNPEAYLRRTMVNLAANERRRLGRWRRARSRLVPTDAEPSPASYPSDVSDLLALPAAARAVLWLVDVEGWTFDQVANLLGCSPEAARARASRARGTLRHLLRAEEQAQQADRATRADRVDRVDPPRQADRATPATRADRVDPPRHADRAQQVDRARRVGPAHPAGHAGPTDEEVRP